MKLLSNFWHQAVSKDTRGVLWILPRFILWLFSLIYLVILKLRSLFYATGLMGTSLNTLVISVGNLTLGGTGKTPMVAYLAKIIAQKGKTGAILSRGYGKTSPSTEDDEAFIMSEFPRQGNITRHTGKNRTRIARTICQESPPNVIILDDGFQHRRMKRDIDIVMINSLSPFGNDRLFPFGHLREPRQALSRADLIVLTHTDLADPAELSHLINYLERFKHPIIKSIHKPAGLIPIKASEELTIDALGARRVWAFCGIGHPLGFRKTLQRHGINPIGFTPFPDHYAYTEEDIKELNDRAKLAGADVILTTQKDQMRLARLNMASWPMPVYALKVELKLVAGKEFLDRILNL